MLATRLLVGWYSDNIPEMPVVSRTMDESILHLQKKDITVKRRDWQMLPLPLSIGLILSTHAFHT